MFSSSSDPLPGFKSIRGDSGNRSGSLCCTDSSIWSVLPNWVRGRFEVIIHSWWALICMLLSPENMTAIRLFGVTRRVSQNICLRRFADSPFMSLWIYGNTATLAVTWPFHAPSKVPEIVLRRRNTRERRLTLELVASANIKVHCQPTTCGQIWKLPLQALTQPQQILLQYGAVGESRAL